MRGSSWKTWAYCVAAAGFKIWLVAPQAISLGTKNSLQWLYLLVGQELSQGHWLGSSPRLAMRFSPGYSCWISFNHLLDIPLRLGVEALLILAAFVFLLALRRARVPDFLSCLLFTLIVFDPATLALFQKVSPQTLSWPLILLAAGGYFLSTYAEKPASKALLGLLAGLSLAAYWLSQSSGLVPGLLLAWMILWELGLQPPGHSWGRRLLWVLPVLGLLVGPTLIFDLSVRTLNQIHYDRFALQKVSTLRSDELVRFQDSAAREKLFEDMAGNRPPSARTLRYSPTKSDWRIDADSRLDPGAFVYLDVSGERRIFQEVALAWMPAEELDLLAAGFDFQSPGWRPRVLEAMPRVYGWAAGFLLFSLLLTAPIVAWNRLRTGAPKSGDFWLFVFSEIIAVSVLQACEGDLRGFDWMGAAHWPLAPAVTCLGLLLLHQASKAVEAWALPKAPRRVERWFLGYALLFGVFFVFANPPFQGPDEIRHGFRSYQVSEALPRSAAIPQSLVTVHSRFEFLPFRPANKTSLDQLLAAWKIPLNPEHRNFHGSTGTSFFPNLPQGLGMFLGRQLGLPAVGLMYMGRLFNLFFWIALVYLAIRQLPFYQWLFCFAALSPMGLYQAASLSYDAFTNGMCFLLISTFLSMGYGSGIVRFAKLAAMLVQGVLASLAKLLYFPLVLLYLLIPVGRLGSKLRYGAVFALLLLSSWGVNFLWSLQSRRVSQIITPGEGHRHGSLSFMLSHPWEFLALVGRTLKGHRAYLEGLIGNLGWTDTHLPTGLLFLYAIGFLLIALWDNRPGIRLGVWPRLLALAVVSLVGLALFAFFYLTWSPLEATTILGLQGRYFIPVVPALALVFYWNRGEGRRLPALDALVPWLSALVLGVAGAVLLVRYYPL